MPHIESDQAVMSMCKGHAPVTDTLHVESENTNLELQIKNLLYNTINDRASSGDI